MQDSIKCASNDNICFHYIFNVFLDRAYNAGCNTIVSDTCIGIHLQSQLALPRFASKVKQSITGSQHGREHVVTHSIKVDEEIGWMIWTIVQHYTCMCLCTNKNINRTLNFPNR